MAQARQEIDRHDLITIFGFSFGFLLFLWGIGLLEGPRFFAGVIGFITTLFAIWRFDRFRNLATLIFVSWTVFLLLSKNTGTIAIQQDALKAWILNWWWIVPFGITAFLLWFGAEKTQNNQELAKAIHNLIKTDIALSVIVWFFMGTGQQSGIEVIGGAWSKMPAQQQFIALVALWAGGITAFSKDTLKSLSALIFVAASVALVVGYQSESIKFIGDFTEGIINIIRGVAKKLAAP
ncbi:MAG: hypothetical protein HY472_00615 [Candidatus Sungbacteria bacterium]|nr:hypothetical protein [Candidatus Sungbacteria bacterium]